MKPTTFAISVVMIFAMNDSSAQLRKCVGPDGKVTYSDTLCSSTAIQKSDVKVYENALDSSEARTAVESVKKKELADQAIQQGSGTCKFEYYAIGDSKGKEIARAAKQECLNNLAAKATGQSTSDEAYTRWRDHRMLTKRTVCTGNSQFSGTATPMGYGAAVNGTSTGTAVCR